MKKAKEYFLGVDLIRIIAGVGVVFLHVTDPFLAYPPFSGVGGFSWIIINIINAAFRVSVPLFIMISGYLLIQPEKELNFREFYKKRVSRIIIPFIVWLGIFFGWNALYGNVNSVSEAFVRLLTVNLEHLYFLVIILELYFITPVLWIFFRNTKKQSHFVFIATTICFTLLLALTNLLIPEARVITGKNILTIFLPFISYFVIGWYLKHVQISSLWKHVVINVFIVLVIFTAFVSNGEVNSYWRSYGSPHIFLMSVLVFLVFISIRKLPRFLSWIFPEKMVKHVASTIFGVYLVHMLVINVFDQFGKLSPESLGSAVWYIVGLKFLLVMFVSYVTITFGRRIPHVSRIFG